MTVVAGTANITTKTMDENQHNEFTRKERKETRRQERMEEKQKLARRRGAKRITKIALGVAIVAGSIVVFAWYIASRPSIPEGEIVSRRGLHFHPELTVFVKREKVEVPANLGIGAIHNPMHTHDTSGVIHLEFQGVVRRDDLKLEKFFEVWGKDFMEFGSSVIMTVNGEKNVDLQNYVMGDRDKIEIHYNK